MFFGLRGLASAFGRKHLHNVAAGRRGAPLHLETIMSKFHEKAQALTKQIIGQMVGDDEIVREGKEQQQKAEREGRPASDRRDRPSELH